MLNDFQAKLYTDLIHLVETNEAFLTKIQTLDNINYRVFDYRLATHTDFLLPNARESRGIMFELGEDGNPVRLACFMPQKFFNYGEGDTLKLDITDSNIDGVMDKLDGSIISTFMHKGELRLKSKTSLHSDHAKQAEAWLALHPMFKKSLHYITESGYSVHMELTSPDLRIVVGYEEVKLTILSMREIATGKMINHRSLSRDIDSLVFMTLIDHWVKDLPPGVFGKSENPFVKIERPGRYQFYAGTTHVADFIKSVKAMTGVEGYIVRLKCGEHVKIKCDWYCALHHTKDSVSAPRRLFECVVNGGSDDLKGMFGDDKITIARIVDMEERVKVTYNRIVKTVEDFYEANKGLDRKEYAILAKSQDADGLMGLKMALYLGRENSYKAFALKHMEMFGVNVHQVYETIEE